MGKRCLKCGYERQPTDTAPDYECPSCGAIYAKVEAARGHVHQASKTNTGNNRPTKRCPYCGEEIFAVAKKCKHCQSDLSVSSSTAAKGTRSGSDYGIFLLAVPAIATLLMWYWVGNMNLLQNPAQTLSLIGISTVAITALIAALESSRVGMTSNKKRGTYSPISWFFIILLLWIVGYPAYLYKRSKYGLTNFLIAGLVITAFFVASSALLAVSIEQQKDKVRGILGLPQSGVSSEEVLDLQRQNLEASLDIYRLDTGRYPSTSEGLEALIRQPAGIRHWNGPYLDDSTSQSIFKFSYENVDGKPILTPR